MDSNKDGQPNAKKTKANNAGANKAKAKQSGAQNAVSDQASLPDIDPMMLGTLVCPKTRGPLIYDKQAQELISKKAKLAYFIREGVPIMLIEEARALEN